MKHDGWLTWLVEAGVLALALDGVAAGFGGWADGTFLKEVLGGGI